MLRKKLNVFEIFIINFQDWFVMCAQLISKISNKPVQWLTPLGLPVIQPYHRTVKMNKYGAFMEDKYNMFQ